MKTFLAASDLWQVEGKSLLVKLLGFRMSTRVRPAFLASLPLGSTSSWCWDLGAAPASGDTKVGGPCQSRLHPLPSWLLGWRPNVIDKPTLKNTLLPGSVGTSRVPTGCSLPSQGHRVALELAQLCPGCSRALLLPGHGQSHSCSLESCGVGAPSTVTATLSGNSEHSQSTPLSGSRGS